TVTAFEAKTHLSELLKKVMNGDSFIVTLRGKPVAKIISFREESSSEIESAVTRLSEIRKTVKGGLSIKEMIEEGRKY
ncbi:MAG TPA: type II toxin-antitoxin system prevent-host-death family antitoxin, partial [Leptospiraceae bacterium]|nr:type II toxin-antitoxin system prevent-host-death family antitoxin [Leptospiraceae bacterium]